MRCGRTLSSTTTSVATKGLTDGRRGTYINRAFRRVRDRVKWGRLFRSVRCAHSAPQTPPFQKPDSTLNNPIRRLDNPDHFNATNRFLKCRLRSLLFPNSIRCKGRMSRTKPQKSDATTLVLVGAGRNTSDAVAKGIHPPASRPHQISPDKDD